MSFRFDISAGEFFELIRPAVLVLSALVSVWVLASARRRFAPTVAVLWALATLFFPLIFLPLYLILRFVRKRRSLVPQTEDEKLVWRITIPLAYAVIVLSLIGFYLYREQMSVDAHLARAAQARVRGDRVRTIAEYHAALRQEDDPHTHKLLAIELADAGDRSEALSEFRRAEQGGEPDDMMAYRMGMLLDSTNNPNEARLQYQKFLASKACTQPLPDSLCSMASAQTSAAH